MNGPGHTGVSDSHGPVRRPPFAPLDWALEALMLVAVVATVADVAMHYSALPEMIPVHFSSGGTASRLGARSELWIILGIVVFFCAMLWAMARYLHQLDRSSVQLQPGHRPLNDRQFLATRAFLLWLNLELAWMFAFSIHDTVRAGLDRANIIGEPVILGFLVIMGATLLVYLIVLAMTSVEARRN